VNPVLSDVERNILLQIAAGRVPSEEVDHLPEVTEELRQALDNQGKILIKTWFEGNTVLISISDTGCGIPNEALPHIFNPFFTTKDPGKGTGLGLAVAYDIVVNKHGGSIEAESTVGVGTTFTIMLPIKREAL